MFSGDLRKIKKNLKRKSDLYNKKINNLTQFLFREKKNRTMTKKPLHLKPFIFIQIGNKYKFETLIAVVKWN